MIVFFVFGAAILKNLKKQIKYEYFKTIERVFMAEVCQLHFRQKDPSDDLFGTLFFIPQGEKT